MLNVFFEILKIDFSNFSILVENFEDSLSSEDLSSLIPFISISASIFISGFSNISYIGGGFQNKGLHNILEPCAYGNPVIFGKHFEFSNEAKALIKLKGGFSIQNSKQLKNTINGLLLNANKLKEIEIINSKFIDDNLVSINSITKSMQNE